MSLDRSSWRLFALAPSLALPIALIVASEAEPVHAAPTEPGTLEQDLSPAQACSSCHEFFSPPDLEAEGGTVDPWAWRGSMMGNAARDPVFWAAVALAAQDHPGETEECVRCHSPRAFLDGQAQVTELAGLSVEQREGVECDACHRMMDDGETPPGNARFVLADAPEGELVPRFGPWAYEMPGPEPQHPWAQDLEFLPSSEMCGVCHDVTTPRERLDDLGVGLGVLFNEQRTYSEWLGSDYADQGGPDAATCQDCHLPVIEGSILGCNMFAGMPHESGGRRHVLAGANATTLRVMKSLYGSAGTGEVEDARFDQSIAWTEEFVASAASLAVDFPAEVDASVGLDALAVTVTNTTGHKLPSGYSEGRVMWLEVSARYSGELVWSSGLWDVDGQVIEADDQVRRYEAVAEQFSDGQSNHLLLNDHWVFDTRLPPKGLTLNTETDPVGNRYQLQDDQTWPHTDETSYAFPAAQIDDLSPGVVDELEIRVRLLYLINTPEYLQLLVDDNLSNQAGVTAQQAFADVGGPEPILLAESTASVPLTGLIGSGETGDSESGEGPDDSGDTDTNTDVGSTEDDSGTGSAGADEAGGCSCSSGGRGSGSGPTSALVCLGLMGLLGSRRRRWLG